MLKPFKDMIIGSVAATALAIGLVVFFVFPNQQSSVLYSPLVAKLTQHDTTTNLIMFGLSAEVPFLQEYLESIDVEMPTSVKTLKLLTGFAPRDFTSLLEMASSQWYMKSQFQTASGGPVESPPPDFEELAQEDTGQTEESEPTNTDASVFIYHSHSWEAYLPLLEDATKPSEASSTNNKTNVVFAGNLLKEALETKGMEVQHDTTNVTKLLVENNWDYYDSYKLSRQTIRSVTAKNEKIEYMIDIHRDAARKDTTTAKIDGKNYAKVYFIVGTEHETYKQNLNFTETLNKKLKEKYPGISRGVFKKDYSEGDGIYNQDLSKHSILIEMGGVDNTKEELQHTASAIAEVLNSYMQQAEKVTNEEE
ncbi:stage II sporulation protein P [Radiobacillus kanasensis]|uniref:stage II sporulation protein P n=1 Tax=Radiobacillus kanasensis TaxID=2844358 RepID=UPI001E5F01AF|nr:stage II sporulation protein P [Radiobacillus kanasensis]UFT99049.1 stage II sporulation protein P [Radiobacillus kanasensis]